MKTSLDIRALLKRFSYGSRLRPARDWFLVLLCATLLIAVSVGWNLWLLQKVEQGGVIGEVGRQRPGLDERSIEPVRAVFKSREEERRRFRQEYRFVDPSL
jgi:hypothetical protein